MRRQRVKTSSPLHDWSIVSLYGAYLRDLIPRSANIAYVEARQHLAIARALLRRPAILALDEATRVLDASSEHRVDGAIDMILTQRQTYVIMAHRYICMSRDGK